MRASICAVCFIGLATCANAEPATHVLTGEPANFMVPVAIAKFSGSEYLIANYSRVMLFDRTKQPVKIRIGLDNWLVHGRVIGPNGEVNIQP